MATALGPYSADYIRRQNAQMLVELQESFDNRNNAEVKETSQVAIHRNLEFITEIARRPETGYAAQAIFDARHNAMPRAHSARMKNVNWHSGLSWKRPLLLVLLLSRLERYELDFSGISKPLDPVLQPASSGASRPSYLYDPLDTENSPVDSTKALDRMALTALWFETFRWLQELLQTSPKRAGWPDELVAAAEYYLFFRSMREQESSFVETHPRLLRFEHIERVFRALVFVSAAIALRPFGSPRDFEFVLLEARLHRRIGSVLHDCYHLGAARGLLLEQLRELATALSSLGTPGADCGTECTYRDLSPRLPRLMNDIGRVVETYGDTLREQAGPDLVSSVLDAAKKARDDRSAGLPSEGKSANSRAYEKRPARSRVAPETVAERVAMLWDFLQAYPEAAKGESARCSLSRSDFLRQTDKDIHQAVTHWLDKVGEAAWTARWQNGLGRSSVAALKDLENPGVLAECSYELAHTLYALVQPRETVFDVVGRAEHTATCSERCRLDGNPRESIVVHNRGRMQAKLGRLPEAVDSYRLALALNPEYAQAHENLGLALLQLEECSIAQRHFSVARQLYEGRSNLRTGSLEVNLGEIVAAQHDAASELRRYLQQRSCIKLRAGCPPSQSAQLVVLKRWNSFTPALPSKPQSVGGGYFLALGQIGIAVDPGYGFLKNLAQHGFSLSDIDCIAITHLHLDHIADLENLLLLLFERQKRAELREQRIWILAKGGNHDSVSLRLQHRLRALISGKGLWNFLRIIEPPDVLAKIDGKWVHRDDRTERNDTYKFRRPPSKIAEEWAPDGEDGPLPDVFKGIRIAVTSAHHFVSDASEQAQDTGDAASGFLFDFDSEVGRACRIGFTGDTRWWIPTGHPATKYGAEEAAKGAETSRTPLPQEYRNCDVLVAHLGSVYTRDIDAAGRIRTLLDHENKTRPPVRDDDTDRNHLGLSGIYSLIAAMADDAARPTALLLGEYGEEMGKHRLRVAAKLREEFVRVGIYTSCMTADLGLRVQVGAGELPDPDVPSSNTPGEVLEPASLGTVEESKTGFPGDGSSTKPDVRVHCRFCGSENWQPFHNAREVYVEGDDGKEGKVVYYCSRHHREHVVDSVRRRPSHS